MLKGGSGSTTSVASKTVYDYDSDGNRIRSALFERFVPEGYDPENPPVETLVLKSTTEYLTDDRNPTGYSQVLSETTFDANGATLKKTIYSVGHDQISQTVYDYSASSQQPTVTSQFFGTDGHGSVRVLVDAVAAVVRDPAFQLQLYTFDAYGNLLGWTNAQPLTSYLYSGESFDFSIGQQYLRARFYDATTGRFNRLDPFFGNSADPQSFHKYGYVHGDPVHGIDPTGMFLGTLLGVGVGLLLPGPGDFIQSGLESLVRAYAANLEWDMEWALDMSLPDSWGSRLDDSWVLSALGNGLHDAFDINTPFGTFNPLDPFIGGDASASAMRGPKGPSGGVSSVFFRGAHKAMHSLSSMVYYAKDAVSTVKNLVARVTYFYHAKLGQHIVKFPERVKAAVVRISPTAPPNGDKWEDLSENTTNYMSHQDILKATEELRRRNGGQLPAGMQVVGDAKGTPNGQVVVNGELHTWHHSYKKGIMELIPTRLHRESMRNQIDPKDGTVGPHIGHALWWKRL